MSRTVTNEMIWEQLQKMDLRLGKIEGKLDAVEVRLGAVEVRLDAVEGRLSNIEQKLEFHDQQFKFLNQRIDHIESMVKEMWEERNGLKVSVTRTLLTTTGILSGVVALVVSFVTGKAIYYGR